MEELNEITRQRNSQVFLTVDRSGRIYLSAQAVRRFHLDPGDHVSFFIDKENRFYFQSCAGKIPLRALPGKTMLACNSLAFANRLFAFLTKQNPENAANLGSLYKCLIATIIDDNGLHRIIIQ